jgi:uncharacterized protein YlzI (FlbEa/FlbD family)
MLQHLTAAEGDREASVWVNLDHILKISSLEPRPRIPSTMIEFVNGKHVAVFESAQEIAILANTPKLT